jgi:hypothetical protein
MKKNQNPSPKKEKNPAINPPQDEENTERMDLNSKRNIIGDSLEPTTEREILPDPLDESYNPGNIYMTTDISELDDGGEPSFMADRTYDPSQVVTTLSPDSITYGNFFVFLTWGQFPILMLSKEWKLPVLSFVIALVLRIAGVGLIELFMESGAVFYVLKLLMNIAVLAYFWFVFGNPGVAGFNLGSSIQVSVIQK